MTESGQSNCHRASTAADTCDPASKVRGRGLIRRNQLSDRIWSCRPESRPVSIDGHHCERVGTAQGRCRGPGPVSSGPFGARSPDTLCSPHALRYSRHMHSTVSSRVFRHRTRLFEMDGPTRRWPLVVSPGVAMGRGTRPGGRRGLQNRRGRVSRSGGFDSRSPPPTGPTAFPTSCGRVCPTLACVP